MKKSLLALAVLTAITGVASAQSSVTVYGKIDLGLALDSGSASGKSVRLDSGVTGGSRLGFKGVEDLGGGMKAAFQLETGFCADSAAQTTAGVQGNFCTGSNSFMGRQAHGDLTGSFGALSAGRQYSLDFLNLTTTDPFGTGLAGQTANTTSTGTIYLVDPGSIRLNNSVQYTTPNMAGFTASAEMALTKETTGNWEGGREIGGALTYASGPAYVSLTYYDLNNANGSGTAQKDYLLGATYDFGVVKIHGLVQKVTGSPTGAAAIDWLAYMAGVTVPLGGGNLLASVIQHDDRTNFKKNATQAGIGYMYPLSKRTSVYTAYAHVSDKNGAPYVIGNATDYGTGTSGFNLGVVHNF